MILSIEGEENAKILCEIDELKGINIYSSNSARAIGTAKYIAEMNNVKIKIDNRINGREFYTTMSMKEILLEELEIKRQYLIYLGNSLDNRKYVDNFKEVSRKEFLEYITDKKRVGLC